MRRRKVWPWLEAWMERRTLLPAPTKTPRKLALGAACSWAAQRFGARLNQPWAKSGTLPHSFLS